MDSLNKKRGLVKRKLTNFTNYFNCIKDAPVENTTISILKTKLESLELLRSEFEEIQSQLELESKNDDELESQYNERFSFLDRLDVAIGIAKSFILDHSNKHIQSEVASINSFNGIKLPTISLPKFSGEYKDWLGFRDTYRSLIHENNNISNIQKYHYLKASLVGPALKIIESVDFNGTNYEVAWDLINNRFNNTRLLIHSHCKAIFNLESLNKESADKLHHIIDELTRNLRSLKSLGQSTDNWDTLLIYLIGTKLDKKSKDEWEKHRTNDEIPTLIEFLDFLKSKANLLETIDPQTKSHSSNNNSRTAFTVSTNTSCLICKKDHLIYNCELLLNLSAPERLDKIKGCKLCINCLRPGHIIKNCNSKSSCKICKKRHNILLHIPNQSSETEQITSNHASTTSQVLLSTAIVNIVDLNNKTHKCRVLLDSGSQSNFICEDFAKKLNVPFINSNINVTGINSIQSQINKKCAIRIFSRCTKFNSLISCLVIPQINNNIPAYRFCKNLIKLPNSIKLADPSFNESTPIDMILGAEIFWHLLTQEQIELGKHKPILHKTKLGWVISGPLGINRVETSLCNIATNSQNLGEHFWELDEPILESMDSNHPCERHFIENYSRDVNGRFIVRIPLKHNINLLGDSRLNATKRFQQLERKLSFNQDFSIQYHEFMQEYQDLGHMSIVDREFPLYLLPHHGVIKTDSLTTKLRVVFDGSAKTSSGWSLNDLQFVGPKVQNNIFDILTRFRKHSVVVTADITKMYRQIIVDPRDRPLQCVLWRDNPSQPLSVFSLNTVTYGTASAPYLAIRCLKQLAEDFRDKYPKACKIIANDFYVDDLLTGFDTIDEAIEITSQITSILKTACFPLRKWTSNRSEFLTAVSSSEPLGIIKLGNNQSITTLGITWLCNSDKFSFNIKQIEQTVITKRTILAQISTIFDPLGLVSPSILLVKLIIQKLWSLKINWDDKLPEELERKWIMIQSQLVNLNLLQIDRNVLLSNFTDIELHGFCDASMTAYGACIYVKSYYNEKCKVALLCSKSKVAPIKQLTIPRLELCSALLLTRLMKSVVEILDLNAKIYYWSDSQVVLSWLHHHPSDLQIFVGNRIAEIQNSSNVNNWYYVDTKSNPADIISRGIYPQQLVGKDLWWNDPNWCSNSNLKVIPFKSDIENIFNKCSNLKRLKRVIAYCFRFVRNATLPKQDILTGSLKVEEFHTIAVQIESILNSRPLCPLSSDPESFNTLTPSHFLIGRPLTSLPDPDYLIANKHRLSRWQLLQQFLQSFWKRWAKEYLSTLQTRTKWTKKNQPIDINCVVLVKEDDLPPNKWMMGRVIELHPGPDGNVRVVTVKTATGTFRRPVTKICLLPTSSDI